MVDAIAAALVYFGAAAGTATTAWAYVIAIAATVAYGGYEQRKAKARARNAANENAKDREVMIRSAIAPRRIVYGRDKISGPIVFMQSTGDKSQFLHLVVALAAHECDAVEAIYFNDVLLPALDGSGFVTEGEFVSPSTTEYANFTGTTDGSGVLTLPGAALTIEAAFTEIGTGEAASQVHYPDRTHTSGNATVGNLPLSTSVTVSYTYAVAGTARVRVKIHLGGSGQTADSDLVSECGGTWTTDHIGAGICYLAVRLEYDQEIFGSIGIPNISAVLRGKKVYDPRTDSTVWSSNPALCIADFLQSDEGMRAVSAEVPDAEVSAAANICDEEIDLDIGGVDTQLRYTCDTSFTTERSPRDVLGELATTMAGRVVWTQGRWLVRAGAYRTPTLTITADMLVGPQTVIPRATRSDLFNAIRATHRDPDQAYAEVQAPLVLNSGYEAEDGAVRIVRQIDIATLADTYRAQRLAKIELERARQAVAISLTTNLRAYDLAPTDSVMLTLPLYGWSAKVFEVLERTLTREGQIRYTMRETAAGVWDWNYGEATVGDLAPNTNLPSPFARPAALTGLAVDQFTTVLSDGTALTQASLTWDASSDAFVLAGGRIDVQWAKISTLAIIAGTQQGDSTGAILAPIDFGFAYVARVRPVNAAGRTGNWSYINFVGTADSGPPENVTNLAWAIKPGLVRITCDPCIARDYAETELRFMEVEPDYDAGDWDAATFLVSGKNNEYHHPRPPNGTYYVLAKHRDTSGNYSEDPAYITVIVDDSIDSGGGTLRLTTNRFPFFAFADGTTHTSSSDDLIITARRVRLLGSPVFTAEAFDAANDSLGTFALTSSGGVCVLTAAQFVSQGTSGSVRYLVVRAALQGSSDTLTVFRQDPTITEPRIYLDNPRHEVGTDADGNYGDYSEAFTDVEVYVGITVVTDDFEFTITPDAGLTATINGGAGPVDGEVDITVAVSSSTISDGVVEIAATDGIDNLSAEFRVVKRPASGDAYTAFFDPSEIVLPVAFDGTVTSYANARSDYYINHGTLPDIEAWALTKEDLGVVSTLTGSTVRVTSFVGLGGFGSLISNELTPATGWQRGNSATWCGDVWVVFGYNSSSDYSTVLRSSDFEVFVADDIGQNGNWDRGAFGGTLLVAIESGISGNRIIRSADKGLTWTLDTMSQTAVWDHIHFGDGFLASASASTAGSYSADGDTWANRTLPASGCSLAFAAPAWAAVSPAGALYTSSDSGTTWSGSRNSLMSLPAGLLVHRAVGFLGAIVAALDGPTDHVKISIDGGATWFTAILPGDYSDPAMLLIVQDVLYLVSDDLAVYCTADGLTWTEADGAMVDAGIADGIYGIADSLNIDYLPVLRYLQTAFYTYRMYITAGSEINDGYSGVGGFECWTGPGGTGTELAQPNKTLITFSDSQDTTANAQNYLTDYNWTASSQWLSQYGVGLPHWIRIDFATSQPIASFVTGAAGDSSLAIYPKDFLFQYSPDGGTTWFTLVSVTGKTWTSGEHIAYDLTYPGVPWP